MFLAYATTLLLLYFLYKEMSKPRVCWDDEQHEE